MGIGIGYGKLILFGEHAAVFGYPAVGMQMSSHLEITTEPCVGDQWILPRVDGTDQIERAIAMLPGLLGSDPPPSRVLIGGDLPVSVGFGSSAAFCTALLKAVSMDDALTRDPLSLWSAAHTLEGAFHGTPSGIDTGLSIHPGASALYPSPPGLPRIEPVSLPEGWLVAGALPRSRNTAELVAGVRDRQVRDPGGTRELLDRLGDLAESVIDSGPGSNLRSIGAAATAAHAALGELGVGSEELDAVVELLMSLGALGAKLSGAGGGGAFFGICAQKETAIAAAVQLQQWLVDNDLTLNGRSFVQVLPLGSE